MSTKTFEAEFQRRLEDIKTRAAAAGTTITALCNTTGIARATPDRWAKRPPKTIKLIDDLEKALAEVERKPRQQ